MPNNTIMQNQDRYQQGMQISGIPQRTNIRDLLNKQQQVAYTGAFPYEPYPIQAILTKLEKIIVDFKDIEQLIKDLENNPVIMKEKKTFIGQLMKNIKKIAAATVKSVSFLDKIVGK